MSDVELLLQASFDRMLPVRPVAAEWEDVLERAGVRPERGSALASRRRYVVAALALLALVAVVGAAYALGHPIVRFSSAPRARSRTVVDFFGRMTLFGGPKLKLHQARRITDVRIDGRDYVLRVAPDRHGFCYAWSNALTGCDDRRTPTRYAGHNLIGPLAMLDRRGGREFLNLIGGSFRQARTARIVITYADGRSSEIPFVWVTAPIREGFYLYGIPSSQQRLGHAAVRIALLDRSGHTLDSQPLFGVAPSLPVRNRLRTVRHTVAGYPPLNVPAAAEWAKRAQLFGRRTESGTRLGLWTAPARTGGDTCYWSNIHAGCEKLVPGKASASIVKLRWSTKLGAYEVVSPPSSSVPHPRYWLKVMRGHGYVALCCTLDPRARSAVLLFQDGDRVTVTPKRGYLIWPIPRRRFAPGHRLEEVDLYGGRRQQIGTVVFQPRVRALYPCTKPKNYGFGFRMCP